MHEHERGTGCTSLLDLMQARQSPVSSSLKLQINEFLYPLMRGDMTLDEFDELTCRVYDLIVDDVITKYD